MVYLQPTRRQHESQPPEGGSKGTSSQAVPALFCPSPPRRGAETRLKKLQEPQTLDKAEAVFSNHRTGGGPHQACSEKGAGRQTLPPGHGMVFPCKLAHRASPPSLRAPIRR